MGAAASVAKVAGIAAFAGGMSLPAAAAGTIFVAGVAVGAVGAALGTPARDHVVNVALDSVYDAAEAMMGYLHTAASSALVKLKAAAASLKDKVIQLVRHLRGDNEAAAARREVADAAALDAGLDVLTRASRPVLQAPSSPGGALALLSSVAGNAARAARRVSEMMVLIEAVYPALRYSIPQDARVSISVVVALVGIGLEAIAATAAAYA